MDEVPITGIQVSTGGGLGWLDGLKDRVFGVADAYLAREFPEQLTHSGANEEVRDTEVDAELPGFLSNDNLVRGALILAAIAAVVIVVKKA